MGKMSSCMCEEYHNLPAYWKYDLYPWSKAVVHMLNREVTPPGKIVFLTKGFPVHLFHSSGCPHSSCLLLLNIKSL